MALKAIQTIADKKLSLSYRKVRLRRKSVRQKANISMFLKICILHALRNICIPLFFVCCLIRMPIMEWGKASWRLF